MPAGFLINDWSTTTSASATNVATSISVAAAVPGAGASDRVYIRNRRTGEIFLITSGANGTTWTVTREAEDASRFPKAAMNSGDNLDAIGSRLALAEGLMFYGTWTPTLIGSSTAGSQTYTDQTGKYWKLGPLVVLEFSVAISAKDGAMAGNVQVGGLPYAAIGLGAGMAIGEHSGVTLSGVHTHISLEMRGGAVLHMLENGGNVGASAFVPVSALAASSSVSGSGVFMTNS